MVIKNKRGWIRIVEAFVAILLIAGTLLIIINKGYLEKEDSSSKIYDLQISILREIELNNEFREQILNAGELPINWDDINFPLEVKNKILYRTPNYLKCEAKICEMDKICELKVYPNKNVYAQAVAITATLKIYKPRQLKLFCWEE